MKQFKRSERLGEQIHRDVSRLLESELAEYAPGLVTFTGVKLSDDLRYAKVYYSYLGREEDRLRIEEYLLRERRRIRTEIGHELHMRNIPEFTFTFDPSIEEGVRIEKLLNEIKNERNPE
jgi:ribosome-binding factor A